MSAVGGADDTRHVITETRIIAAPRQVLFDLVADPSMHPRIDGSGTVRAHAAGGPGRLGAGVRFGMSMRMGLPYRISNRVVEFEEGSRIAWMHLSRAVWRWEFRDVDGGTEVRESFDWSSARSRTMMRRFVPGNIVSMRRSLERLAAIALERAAD